MRKILLNLVNPVEKLPGLSSYGPCIVHKGELLGDGGAAHGHIHREPFLDLWLVAGKGGGVAFAV